MHISFLKLNEVLKVADSFAYLQMAHGIENFSIDGLWTWWFGFLYSFPIAVVDIFTKNDILASFVVNILLFNVLVWVCFNLWKKYLSKKYNFLFIILLFLSPILLNFNINILSENIYIPIFVILFLWILRFKDEPKVSNSIYLWFLLALLYYTRWEAFIYILSIWIIYLFLLFSKKIDFSWLLINWIIWILSFFIFISPYLFFLHNITWEWWLTNKWSANIRQAELRWVSKMDDDGFEKAVWELTPDNKKLIAWFAWGLKYDKSEKTESFTNYLSKNPSKVIERIWENQTKLYTSNIPNLVIWNSFKLYNIEWSRIFYQNNLFFAFMIIPLILMIYGIIMMIKNKEYYFVFSFFSFFLVASFFFTLFFVLDRYFVIFVPLFIFFIVYGIEKIYVWWKKWLEILKYLVLSWIVLGVYSLGTFSYYNTIKWEDARYEVKKIAWEWLYKYHGGNLIWKTQIKIMERFPIVTYYSGTKERWLTPYTDKLENVVEYAKYNNLDYLIVDSLDFYTYRPDLRFLFDESRKSYEGVEKVKEFEKNGEKVVIYRVVR